MNNELNETFIGESVDCLMLGEGTIIEITSDVAKIYLEQFDEVIELPLDEILSEEAEELDELSKSTLGSYIKKAGGTSLDSGAMSALEYGKLSADPNSSMKDRQQKMRKVIKRAKGIDRAVDKLTKEEAELEEGNNKPYVKPHYDAKENQSGWKASNKHGNVKFFGKDFKASAMKHAGLNEEAEELEELSKGTLGRYINRSVSDVRNSNRAVGRRDKGKHIFGHLPGKSDEENAVHKKQYSTAQKREKGIRMATSKLTREEIELEEGRGRKPKQPKEGEKPTAAWLRHLERQKGSGEEKTEVEALGAQLRKAVSINKPVTFLNGDKKEITAGHANLFHDHMDARKMTTDKQKFQNDAHASHDAFMKAIKSPIPGR